MKKLNRFLCLLFLLVLFSCQYQSKTKSDVKSTPENIQQDKFISFLKLNHEIYNGISNDINKSEFVSKYENDLANLSDSLGIFRNWKGQIDDISIFDWTTDNLKEITVRLDINVSEYYHLTLTCQKMYSTKNIDSALVYRQLKKLVKGQDVYFDGILSRDKDNKIAYNSLFTSNTEPDNGKLTTPYMNFNIISISREKFTPTNLSNFDKTIETQLDIWKSMNDYTKGIITRSSLQRKLKMTAIEIKPIVDSLSYDEKEYIKSLTNCMSDQFQNSSN